MCRAAAPAARRGCGSPRAAWPPHAPSSTAPGVPLCVSVLPMKPMRNGSAPMRRIDARPLRSAPRTKSDASTQPPPSAKPPSEQRVAQPGGSFGARHGGAETCSKSQRSSSLARGSRSPAMHSDAPLCWYISTSRLHPRAPLRRRAVVGGAVVVALDEHRPAANVCAGSPARRSRCPRRCTATRARARGARAWAPRRSSRGSGPPARRGR